MPRYKWNIVESDVKHRNPLPCLIPPQWCIVCVPTCVVDCGSYPRSKYKIGISCFSTWHAALMNKSRDWLAQNQDNVSKWSEMSICRLLFHCASTIKSNSACWSSTKQTWSLHCTLANKKLFLPWYNWKIALVVLNNHCIPTLSLKITLFRAECLCCKA
jgi:hypothetical protein